MNGKAPPITSTLLLLTEEITCQVFLGTPRPGPGVDGFGDYGCHRAAARLLKQSGYNDIHGSSTTTSSDLAQALSATDTRFARVETRMYQTIRSAPAKRYLTPNGEDEALMKIIAFMKDTTGMMRSFTKSY